MKKIPPFSVFILLILNLMSCDTENKLLLKNLNNSGYIYLSHYTRLMPTLGPCGFSREKDVYDIKTPRTKGRIESTELDIDYITTGNIKYSYGGYIEFKKDNLVDVELFTIRNRVKTDLTINGIHKVKIKNNTIADKRI